MDKGCSCLLNTGFNFVPSLAGGGDLGRLFPEHFIASGQELRAPLFAFDVVTLRSHPCLLDHLTE